MSGGLPGATEQDKLVALSAKNYKEQAVWFLNAFWRTFAAAEAENLWKYTHLHEELDTANKTAGSALDEFVFHRFLEKINETLTVSEMREELKGLGVDKVKTIPFVHFLIWKYKSDYKHLVTAAQGPQEEIARAQVLLDSAQSALSESRARETDASREDEESTRAAEEAHRLAEENKKAAEDSSRLAAEAKAAAEAATATANEAKAAQAELEAALNALKEQEESYKKKTEELTKASEEGTGVKANKAKAELAQHLGQDNLPLRKAKITTEAATKQAEKSASAATAAADASNAAAGHAASAAESAKNAAAAAEAAAGAAKAAAEKAAASRKVAEAATADALKKVEAAEAGLEEVKKNPGGEGSLWWMDRELHEAKAYLPKKQGGYKKGN